MQKDGKPLIPGALGDKSAVEPKPSKIIQQQGPKADKKAIYVNVMTKDQTELNPTLAYMFLKLAFDKTKESVEVKALHDSGCAATVISTNTFLKLSKSDRTKIIQPLETIYVKSYTGELTQIRGLANIWIRFKGKNGNTLWHLHKVMIHDNIDFDMILGRDITGSSLKIAETNDCMYLSSKPTKITNLQEYIANHTQTLCDAPIHQRSINSLEVETSTAITIPPFTMAYVPCRLKDNQQNPKIIQNGKGSILFEIIAVNVTDLQFLRNQMLDYLDKENIMLPLFNDSNDDYLLEAKTQIAQIEHFNHELPIHCMQMASFDSQILRVNNVRPAFIEEDEYMNEDEKTAAFIDFAEKGHFHHSMSHLVEKAHSLTEMELKNTTPYPTEKFLDQFNLSHLNMKQRKIIHKILRQNKEVFTKHEYDIGKVNTIEMEIEIDETKPRIQKYVPIPHSARGQVRQILDQLEEFNVIRPCNEPSLFCSNLLIVPKKDKKLLRVLLDGRLLNNSTIRKPTNVVSFPEIKIHLTGKTWTTIADVAQAFYQIPLSKKAQPLTAFYSEAHGKRYCFQRAPQGLKNSPLYLKLLMDQLFGDMCDIVIHYADDIMISTTGTFEEHMKAVAEVLARLKKANLKISPKKLKIAQDNVEFLGIIWKKGTLHVPEAKLLAFKNYPIPRTPKQTKSFVCAMSYYRQFIPRFSELSQPLMELTTLNPKQFKWTDKHTEIFHILIDSLIKNASLYLPDPKKTFYVQTDASDICGAGRVYQKGPEGEELLLACISRTFTKAERTYGAFRKEVLALLYTLRSMDFFLRYADNIIIKVDAKAILFLRLCKDSAGILLRFSQELAKYDAEVHHVAGVKNVISDILSRHHEGITEIMEDKKKVRYLSEAQAEHILKRLCIPEGYKFSKKEVADLLEIESLKNPLDEKPKRSSGKEGKRIVQNLPKVLHEKKVNLPKESFRRPGVKLPICACTNYSIGIPCNHLTINYNELNALSKVLTGGKIHKDTFIEMQNSDEFIINIKQRLKCNELKKRPKMFAIEDGILYFGKKNQKPVLPVALLDLLIQSKHYTVFGIHSSKTRILRDIKGAYYVHMPTLRKKLSELRDNCVVCQFNKTNANSHIVKPSNFRKAPRTCWAIDIIPNMPETSKKYKAVFLAVDMFTGYVQLAPLESRKTEGLIEAIYSTIIRPFGSPQIIRCDNETGMMNSKDFVKAFEVLNIKFEPTSTAAPWSNGGAERAVQTIKEGARKFIMQEKVNESWDQYLHFFTMAHNQSTSIYGYAPEELHFGYTMPKVVDLLQFWPNATTHEQYMELIVPKAEEARQKAKGIAERENERVTTYKNKNRATKTFKIGEIVLHKQLQLATGANMGMKPKFTGPFVINKIEDSNSSAIIENLKTGHVLKAHFTNLQLFAYHPNFTKLNSDFEDDILKFMPDKFSRHKYWPKTFPGRYDPSQDSENEMSDVEMEDLEEWDTDRLDSTGHSPNQNQTETQQCENCLEHEQSCICPKSETDNKSICNRCDNKNCTCSKCSAEPNENLSRLTTNNNQKNLECSQENDHPEGCNCAIDLTENYGYQSQHEHNSSSQPKRGILKITSPVINYPEHLQHWHADSDNDDND